MEELAWDLAAAGERVSRLVIAPEEAMRMMGEPGSGRPQELADRAWDDMDADDQRLLALALALTDSVFVDPDGEAAAERVHTSWRF